ncbi:MAG: cysteine desulfurase family protein [Bacilli bacterium]
MYLDNAATTSIHPYVRERMNNIPFANYNAKYYDEALRTHMIIDSCFDSISKLLKIDKKSIVFTSGASESNNYIIKGIYLKSPDAHYITSDREHSSVLSTFKFLKALGANVTIISSANDVISFDDIKPYIKENTKLVSIMAVNNETGIINNYKNISAELRKRNILFHSDVTQALGKIKLDFDWFDYFSMSAHKINGPKGIGIAGILGSEIPEPLIHGSSQQNSNRSGTLPNDLIVGLTTSVELCIENFEDNMKTLANNKKIVMEYFRKNLGEDFELNFNSNTVDNIISLRLKGEVGPIFLHENKEILSASTGSSCSVGNPSYVLKSHGFDNARIIETIRLSTSLYEEVKF